MNIIISLIAVVFVGCSTLIKAPKVEVKPKGHPKAAYARVLRKYVNSRGQVDFEGIRDNPSDLHYYVNYVGKTSFTHFKSKNQKLAHYINAYNALSIFTVIAKGIPDSNSGLAKVKFFYLTKMKVGGEEMSLYTFENDYVRKFGNEKVHFALNCMAVGCPRLPRLAFTSGGIQKELRKEAKYFFSEARNLTVDHKEKVVYLTEILDFFPEDFVPKKAESLIAYVNKYRRKKIPGNYKVKFIPYDWTVNNSNKLQ
jgi:hypothetical protein